MGMKILLAFAIACPACVVGQASCLSSQAEACATGGAGNRRKVFSGER